MQKLAIIKMNKREDKKSSGYAVSAELGGLGEALLSEARVVTDTCTPSTRETEAARLPRVHGQFGLH